jgi:pyridoxal phosphate enzyme (YggS family)
MSIPDNVAAVRQRIAAAAKRAGRSPEAITLMAVTKTCSPESIREAWLAGVRVFGENRVQEFAEKVERLKQLLGSEGPSSGFQANAWHMIGHLQTNKAAAAASLFGAVDSVDSLRLAERLNDAAHKLSRTLDVLIEVNVGGESAKSGVAPDSPDLDAILRAAPRLQNLRVRGLMTVPPFTEDPEAARPHFRALRELRNRIAAQNLPAVTMEALSMGMSHDFEVAIEEGSTCVRVGTAIFGVRKVISG